MFRWIAVIGVGLFISLGASASLSPEQQRYKEIRELQADGYWKKAQQQTRQLGDYALVPYLEYYQLRHDLNPDSYQKVDEYRQNYAGSPLADTLERKYLEVLAREQQWWRLLNFYPQKPNSTVMKCHYYVAQLHSGDREQAWQGARELWLYGKSQPNACDPLFKAFAEAGQLTDELIWQRMLLAFDAGQPAMLKYLQGRLKKEYLKAAKLLRKVYDNPKLLRQHSRFNTENRGFAAVVAHGLKRLAWRDAALTQNLMESYEGELSTQLEKVNEARQQLIRAIIRRPTPELLAWVDKQLTSWTDSETMERRLRLALTEQDWDQVQRLILMLPETLAEKASWKYWLARAYAKEGKMALAHQSLSDIADERSYYGFLAAQQLKAPYRLNPQRAADPGETRESLKQLPGYIRTQELMALNESRLARIEWHRLLSQSNDQVKLIFGELALLNDWPDLAVQAAIKAKAWDELSLRFPVAYGGLFEQFGELRQIDTHLLLAMARQESALYPKARSPVGARGLMQLMPATAKETAQEINFRYGGTSQLYKPEVNIRLGSAYLSGLLNQYDDHRYLAAAAYNAGPHRVRRWQRERADLPADIWIETIPFRETRNYVKNVLAYHLIYSMRAGKPRDLFDEHELDRTL